MTTQTIICSVCKTQIEPGQVVNTYVGPVHAGQCYQHVIETPITENTSQIIEETELLL